MLFRSVMQGEKVTLAPVDDLEKFGLKIDPFVGGMYSQLIGFIKQETNHRDPIFVFPYNPEIDRKSVV